MTLLDQKNNSIKKARGFQKTISAEDWISPYPITQSKERKKERKQERKKERKMGDENASNKKEWARREIQSTKKGSTERENEEEAWNGGISGI